MLKIGTVRWKGKCGKHPMYDPNADGLGAVKGGCVRCQELFEIFEHHQRTLRMMRTFGAANHPPRRKLPDPFRERQQDLFGALS